jgi:hypothetical protein
MFSKRTETGYVEALAKASAAIPKSVPLGMCPRPGCKNPNLVVVNSVVKCGRCGDLPEHPYSQEMAAMLAQRLASPPPAPVPIINTVMEEEGRRERERERVRGVLRGATGKRRPTLERNLAKIKSEQVPLCKIASTANGNYPYDSKPCLSARQLLEGRWRLELALDSLNALPGEATAEVFALGRELFGLLMADANSAELQRSLTGLEKQREKVNETIRKCDSMLAETESRLAAPELLEADGLDVVIAQNDAKRRVATNQRTQAEATLRKVNRDCNQARAILDAHKQGLVRLVAEELADALRKERELVTGAFCKAVSGWFATLCHTEARLGTDLSKLHEHLMATDQSDPVAAPPVPKEEPQNVPA